MMLWVGIVLILSAVVLVLAWPFFREPDRDPGGSDAQDTQRSSRMATNVALYRQRLTELEEELANERLGPEHFDQLVQEQKLLLLQSSTTDREVVRNQIWQRLVVVAMMLLVPVASICLFFLLGERGATRDWKAVQQDLKPHVLAVLEDRSALINLPNQVDTADFLRVMQHQLQVSGGSAAGWNFFSELLQDIGATAQSVTAARKAYELEPDNRAIALRFAQAEMMGNQGKLTPRALRVLRHWLGRSKEDAGVLMLMGMGHFAAADYREAIAAWTPLVAILDNAPADEQRDLALKALQRNLAQAHERLTAQDGATGVGQPILDPPRVTLSESEQVVLDSQNKSGGLPSVTVTVDGPDVWLQSPAPEARLFVFAKALHGPAIPLAVKRLQPKRWPVTVTLTTDDAMMPSATLATAKQVTISARWSLTGQIAQDHADKVTEPQTVDPMENSVVRLRFDK